MNKLDKLTDIEVEILQLIADGNSRKQVAAFRGRSEHTITNQISSILSKLQVQSMAYAVAIGFRKGLIK